MGAAVEAHCDFAFGDDHIGGHQLAGDLPVPVTIGRRHDSADLACFRRRLRGIKRRFRSQSTRVLL